ncbi:MAG: DUF4280 domain-containing protein [Gemmataceae bacterium]
MPEILVCQNAVCSCSASLNEEPSLLTVTNNPITKVNGLFVATQMDYMFGPNLAGFGICDILTTEAEGVETPCAPVLAAPWQGCSTKVKINGLPALLQEATLTCAIGGQISIDDPNNVKVNSNY